MPDINAVLKQVLTRLVLLAFISTTLSVHAADAIKINTYTDYPPYLYHEEGRQAGLYMRIVDITLKAINQPYTVETLPFKRGIYQAAEGDGIIIGIVKTDQRMEDLDFSEPFYQERVSVFYNQPKSLLIKTVEELDGLTIGTLLGWSYGAEFDQAKAANRFVTKDGKLDKNLFLLSKGRLDAVIHSELSAGFALNKLGLKDDVFLGSEPLALADIYFAVKKGTKKEFLEKINLKLSDPEHIKEINSIIESYK